MIQVSRKPLRILLMSRKTCGLVASVINVGAIYHSVRLAVCGSLENRWHQIRISTAMHFEDRGILRKLPSVLSCQ
jgi:hypothetical protein